MGPACPQARPSPAEASCPTHAAVLWAKPCMSHYCVWDWVAASNSAGEEEEGLFCTPLQAVTASSNLALSVTKLILFTLILFLYFSKFDICRERGNVSNKVRTTLGDVSFSLLCKTHRKLIDKDTALFLQVCCNSQNLSRQKFWRGSCDKGLII